MTTLSQLSRAHFGQKKTGRCSKRATKVNKVLGGAPQRKGTVLATLILKPKKPNSANRKAVRVKLSTGYVVKAYIPGIMHNINEHAVVLVRKGQRADLPSVNYIVVRGKYDATGVQGRKQGRSKYGAAKPAE